MPKIVYIGKEPWHFGKSAFQILANLKNFGLGRMLTRSEYDKYAEPSYYKIRQVLARMDEELLFGNLWVDEVFRARRLPGLRNINDGYKRDFRLIPKDEEKDFLRGYQITEWAEHVRVLPKDYTVPPLMKIFLTRHRRECGEDVECFDKIPFVYPDDELAVYRIAEPGEPTDEEFGGSYKFNDFMLEGVKPI